MMKSTASSNGHGYRVAKRVRRRIYAYRFLFADRPRSAPGVTIQVSGRGVSNSKTLEQEIHEMRETMKRVAFMVSLVVLLLLPASPSSARGGGGGSGFHGGFHGVFHGFGHGFGFRGPGFALGFGPAFRWWGYPLQDRGTTRRRTMATRLRASSCSSRRSMLSRRRSLIGTTARVQVPTTRMSRPAGSRG
jgi:hypothetical protein